MARIRSGVLGNIRGKVAGVVGGQWKDKNYLREYVKPANPKTVDQEAQRSKMSRTVAFCKPLVGPIFNAYTDKFQKSMSGFNRFVKTNIAFFTEAPDYSDVVLSDGPLFPVDGTECTYNSGNGQAIYLWEGALGNNGAVDDQVYACAYDKINGLWYFAAAEVDRQIHSIMITLGEGLTPANIFCWAIAARYKGSIVDIISHSDYQVCTAP